MLQSAQAEVVYLYLSEMKRVALSVCSCLLSFLLFAQTTTPPFQQEINAFKKKDSLQMPAKHAILFVGSSSFTKWTDVQSYFPAYPIINRGFGGSALPDVIRYANEIIFPYDPKQIIIYCGENDVAASDTITAQTVLQRFQQLFFLIRSRMPKVPVAFISLKPSPSRWKFQPVVVEANRLIKQFLSKQSKATYVNVYDAMLTADGLPKQELFLGDNLHMNEKGYAIWQKILLPVLKQ